MIVKQEKLGELIRQSLSFGFTASNNEAEYESLIAGFQLAKAVMEKRLSAYCNSKLVASQFCGDYDVHNERMDAYLKVVQTLAKDFEFFELTKVPRGENVCADALAALGSRLRDQVKQTIPIHKIDKPSIKLTSEETTIIAPIFEAVAMEEDSPTEQIEAPDWRTEFIDYLVDGKLPPRELDRETTQNTKFPLRRLGWRGPLMDCNQSTPAMHPWRRNTIVMAETHEGAAGNHSGGRALALKVKSLGFYWLNDAINASDTL